MRKTSNGDSNVIGMVAHLRSRVDELEGSRLAEQLAAKQEEVNDLRSQLGEMERQLEYTQSVLGSLEEEMAELKARS